MNKKKVIVPIVASILTLGILTGVSYAYFSAKITDNNKTETIIKSNELEVVFTGTQEIIAEDAIPGDVFTKKFTVKNTSNVAVKFNIYLENITNEFNKDLVYTLSDEDGIVVSETVLPTTSTAKNYLIEGIPIESGVTKSYTMKVEFKYSTENQDALQGAMFKATLGIDTNKIEINITKSSQVLANVSEASDEQPVTGTVKIVNDTSKTQTYDLMLSDLVDIEELSTGYAYSVYKNEEEAITNKKLPTTDQVILENQILEPSKTDIYTISIEISTLCKRATTLHTEICSQSSSYCAGDGYSNGDNITYGNLGTSGTLATGDAFDCDVNGDGTYDAETERFYYVSDMTNGVTTYSNTAVLIYYNNVSGGEPSNTTVYVYDSSGSNNNGPVTAKTQLPTTSQWSNVSLKSTIRQITNEVGGTTTSAGNLPLFNYEGYSARLLTYQEVYNGCYDGTTAINSTGGLSTKCKYLMENTKYSSSSLATYGPWLESPNSSNNYRAWDVHGGGRFVYYGLVDMASIGVRPAIEVLKSDISY